MSLTSSKVPNFKVPSFIVTCTKALTSAVTAVVGPPCAKVHSGTAAKAANKSAALAANRERERFMIEGFLAKVRFVPEGGL